MRRRQLLALSAGGLTTIAGYTRSDTESPTEKIDAETRAQTDDTEDETEETEDPVGELTAVGDILDPDGSFSGSGQEVTDTFALDDGFTAFVLEHDGESNFQIELIDDDSGETAEFLANEIGTFDGAVGTPIESGTYLMDVNADGDWSIEYGSPSVSGDFEGPPPASIEGSGPNVWGVLNVAERVTIVGSHDGERNFQVEFVENSATDFFGTTLIFNEIGEFDGETSEQLDGLGWVIVNADGNYEISIE